jgi:hypothetical protein
MHNTEVLDNPRGPRRRAKTLGSRLTVSLTQEQHKGLQELADKHSVTLAWLARYAVDQLLRRGGSQLPLPLHRD